MQQLDRALQRMGSTADLFSIANGRIGFHYSTTAKPQSLLLARTILSLQTK